ncbi:MAG: NitT/TauT family transport system substrate-binding protein [Pseudonocardiales bacterium]|jgi:NitT/TauT family transport system substrate-binding protein|nr:NitT/TauT family transport system substrate-binding protein [Pseudonocardiales bacterium]
MDIARRANRVRMVAALTAAVCATSVLAACSSSGGDNKGSGAGGTGIKGQRFKVLIASSPSPNKVVEQHVIDILKNEGVNASLVFTEAQSSVQLAQVTHGDVDAYAEATAGAISAINQGIPLVDFGLLQPRQDYVFIARPGINSLADLKGKKIGVIDTVGVNWAQALIVLKEAGLTANDVHMVTAGGQSARLSAMVAGRIDATMLSHSAQIQLEPKGYKVLYDYTRQASELYDDNLFATKKWLDSHQELALAVNKAILQSFAWFNDPANADAVLNRALEVAPGSDKQATKQLLETLRTGQAYPEGTILDTKVIDQEQQLFLSAKAIEKTAPTAQWVQTSFGEQAKAALASGTPSTGSS